MENKKTNWLMRLQEKWAIIRAHLDEYNKYWFTISSRFLFFSSCAALLMYVYMIGYTDAEMIKANFFLRTFDFFYFNLYFLGTCFRVYLDYLEGRRRVSMFEYIISSTLLFNIVLVFFANLELLNQTMVLLIFGLEVSKYSFDLSRLKLSPTLIFVVSFVVLIFVGAILLMLPNSTSSGGIRFLDALFTAASATTVTGLAVLDTSSDFTTFGQTVILMLIQLGGLGMMTFTSFFGIFFKGESSFQNTLFVQDYMGADKTSEAFHFVIKTVVFTLCIEFLGFALLYTCTADTFLNESDHFFFSLFHAISAFCNAGFSTLSAGLYDINIRFNYGLQWVICGLIIAGGIGFPIMFNVYAYLKYAIRKVIRGKFFGQKFLTSVWIINLNTRIVFYTTAILLVSGTVLFFIFERNGVLVEHETLWGKITTSFFGSVTPRTAGFNTVDMSALAAPTLLITIFLMWVGASPASTGGGIKTSSIAIAVLNIFSVGRGLNRIDVGKRTLAERSIHRAFAIIMLSIIFVSLSTFLLVIFEPHKRPIDLAFEAFSAYSTAGLSINLTSSLSDPSRLVLIITMFLGRVGTINLIISLLHQVRQTPYEYPSEHIMIN
jgi:potassium uptake TrkH family protein